MPQADQIYERLVDIVERQVARWASDQQTADAKAGEAKKGDKDGKGGKKGGKKDGAGKGGAGGQPGGHQGGQGAGKGGGQGAGKGSGGGYQGGKQQQSWGNQWGKTKDQKPWATTNWNNSWWDSQAKCWVAPVQSQRQNPGCEMIV